MHLFLALVITAALVLYFFWRRRGRGSSLPSESSSVLDRWIKDAIPTALASHLGKHGVDLAQVAKALGGDPDPAVVSTLEQHVREVQIEYLREAHGPDVEVILRVRFDDGEQETARRRMTLAEVPAGVRDDFEKKATTRVFRDWHFPWVQGL